VKSQLQNEGFGIADEGIATESKVAQTIGDVFALVELDALNDMRVMPDDRVR